MNRFTPGVPVVLVLSAWSVAALAADEPSAAAPAAATAAAASARGTAPPPSTGKVVQTKASTAPSTDPSVRRLVCLNMSLQCFSMKPKADDARAKAQTASLDLKAPDIHRVIPDVQLHAPLDEPIDIEDQQVAIEGTRPEVYVPGGIASLPWAVMHPTQAWRIFLPVPPGVAK
ncbi:MAG: hypothetical protein WDO68_13135 [Gammaproteobacteria bacterium]